MSKGVLTVGSQSNIINGLTTQLTYDLANAEKNFKSNVKVSFRQHLHANTGISS